jgi:hypothetical protein
LLHAAIAAGGGFSIMLFGRGISAALDAGATRPMRPSAMTLKVEG